MTNRCLCTTLTMIASVVGPACMLQGDPAPEPGALVVEHRSDPVPMLAAVDEEGRAHSTFWSAADESSERVVVTLEDPGTGQHGQLHSRTDVESGITEVNVTGDFGEGTWSSEGLADDAAPPESLVGRFQPWLEFWNQTMADPAHAAHVSGSADRDLEVAPQDLACKLVCGMITYGSCKLIKHPGALAACHIIGNYECDSMFCTTSTSFECMVYTSGQCVRETSCQSIYGCQTTNVRGCPE